MTNYVQIQYFHRISEASSSSKWLSYVEVLTLHNTFFKKKKNQFKPFLGILFEYTFEFLINSAKIIILLSKFKLNDRPAPKTAIFNIIFRIQIIKYTHNRFTYNFSVSLISSCDMVNFIYTALYYVA